jgi:hypothetical protein
MTHQEQIDQVSDMLRNSTINSKIIRWLNMSRSELGMNYVFEHLQKYGASNTTVGNPDLLLATDFQWLKSAQIPSLNIILYPEDEEIINRSYPTYRTLQGSVTNYYMSGPRKIGLFHVPSSIKSVTYCYQARPTKLLGTDPNNETSDLPEEFHLVENKKAEAYGWQYEGDTEAYGNCVNEEQKLIKKLGLSRYKRLDAKLVMGSRVTRSGRPAYPKLPSTFPRV